MTAPIKKALKPFRAFRHIDQCGLFRQQTAGCCLEGTERNVVSHHDRLIGRDWSSDVCSSDLRNLTIRIIKGTRTEV